MNTTHRGRLKHFYTATFVMRFAESMIQIFVPIFLYERGYTIQAILAFYLLISVYFVALSLVGARISARIGYARSVLASMPPLIVFYAGIRTIDTHPALFLVLPLLYAVHFMLMNYGLHLHYLRVSEAARRGREQSRLGILMTIASALAPALAGLVIASAGFDLLFLTGAALLVAGALPLLFAEQRHHPFRPRVRRALAYLINGPWGSIASFTGYAIETIIDRTLWPILLIILLIRPEQVGAVYSAALLASIAIYWVVGWWSDHHSKQRLIRVGTLLFAAGWIARLAARTPLSIALVDGYKRLCEKVLRVPWQASMYDLAQLTDAFSFVVSREIVFNAARIVLLPILILIFSVSASPFVWVFAIAAAASLLYPLLPGTDGQKV